MIDNYANRIIKTLDETQNVINVCCLVALVVLVIAQIILRYVLKSSLLGIEEIMTYPTIWLFMIGGASASLNNEHIECGILPTFINDPNILYVFEVIKNICSSIISGVLCIYTFKMAKYSFKIWKTSGTLYIPMFYAEVAMFVGMVLMFVYAVFHLWKAISLKQSMEDY